MRNKENVKDKFNQFDNIIRGLRDRDDFLNSDYKKRSLFKFE